MTPNSIVEKIKVKYGHLKPFLNERSRRLWATVEASAFGNFKNGEKNGSPKKSPLP
jgi:hypothetical protein